MVVGQVGGDATFIFACLVLYCTLSSLSHSILVSVISVVHPLFRLNSSPHSCSSSSRTQELSICWAVLPIISSSSIPAGHMENWCLPWFLAPDQSQGIRIGPTGHSAIVLWLWRFWFSLSAKQMAIASELKQGISRQFSTGSFQRSLTRFVDANFSSSIGNSYCCSELVSWGFFIFCLTRHHSCLVSKFPLPHPREYILSGNLRDSHL